MNWIELVVFNLLSVNFKEIKQEKSDTTNQNFLRLPLPSSTGRCSNYLEQNHKVIQTIRSLREKEPQIGKFASLFRETGILVFYRQSSHNDIVKQVQDLFLTDF